MGAGVGRLMALKCENLMGRWSLVEVFSCSRGKLTASGWASNWVKTTLRKIHIPGSPCPLLSHTCVPASTRRTCQNPTASHQLRLHLSAAAPCCAPASTWPSASPPVARVRSWCVHSPGLAQSDSPPSVPPPAISSFLSPDPTCSWASPCLDPTLRPAFSP